MAHVQAHIDKELLKTVKKATIDKETSMNNFIEEALREKVERDKEQLKEVEDSKKEVVEEAEKSEPSNLTITDNKTQGE